jgi:hypothetical protein
MMKKLLFLSTFLLAVAFSALAQSIEVTPLAGYTFRTTKNYNAGWTRVNDGFTYGGAITIAASKYNAIEISYYRYETTAEAHTTYSGYELFNGPVAMNYIFVGGQRLFPASEKVTGFTGFNVGASWMGSQNNKFNTMTKFAVGIDAGVKIMASEKIGVRLQANLNFPVTNTSGSFYVGTGGSGVAMYGYVPMLSFGFTGGLIFKIK